jgi:hypothetical protein
MRPWDETRGDQFDAWGRSRWLFETDEAGNVLRQVELYDGGQRLRYDENRREDLYGGLSEQPLDPSVLRRLKSTPPSSRRSGRRPAGRTRNCRSRAASFCADDPPGEGCAVRAIGAPRVTLPGER